MALRIFTVCCLLVLTVSNVCIQGVLTIDLSLEFLELSPPEVIVQRNQPLLLNCVGNTSSDYGPLRVSWRYEGEDVEENKHQRVLENGSLLIDRVSGQKKKHGRRDEGNYTCLLHNSIGTMVSRIIRVVIPRMSRSFSVEPESMTVEIGGNAYFLCQIQAAPPAAISWQLNNKDLPQNSSKYLMLPSGALQIVDVSASDEGNYRCVASNAARTRYSSEALLTVLDVDQKPEVPHFLSPPYQHVTVLTNKTAVLECMVRGFPNPEIKWTRGEDDRPLSKDRVSRLGQGNLVIKTVTDEEDAGVYLCTATVRDPSLDAPHVISQKSVLTVHVPPDFVDRPMSQEKPTAQTARFECTVSGIPAPSVQWLKDGQPLYINGRITLKTGNVLVISQTVTSDSGIYQCTATNAVGSNVASARLLVKASSEQPDPPRGLNASTVSSSAILLRWLPPISSKDLRIQAYTVHYLPTSGGLEMQQVSPNTSHLIDKLKPYTNYTFYVRAYNNRSASEQSEAITHMTGEDLPLTAPSVSVKSLTPTTLHVSWSHLFPEEARGVIIGYRIHYRRHNQASYSVIDAADNVKDYTITGLQPKKKYDVRVMAGTKVGFPVLSDEDWPWVVHEMPDAVTATVPMSPILHLTVINTTALELEWSMPSENRYPIDGFLLSYRQQSHPLKGPIDVPSNMTKYLLSDLAPQTWYEVHLLAYNDQGEGPESVRNILTFSENHTDDEIIEVIEPPTHLEADPTSSTSIHLAWKTPVTNKNVSYYTVRYHAVYSTGEVNASSVAYIRSTNKEVMITDLMPFTLYEFSVRSHDYKNQQGRFGMKVECKTLEDIPTAPRDLTWSPVDAHSVRLNWQTPIRPNGIILAYYILYSEHTDDELDFDSWITKEEQGSSMSSLVNGLASNTLYYFCMRAETRAGTGPPTPLISLNIPVRHNNSRSSHKEIYSVEPQDPLLGIVLGISIGVGCIIICAIIIICRNRCFPPPPPPGNRYSTCCGSSHVSQLNGHVSCNGNEKQLVGSKWRELDCFTPMLSHFPNGTVERHLDTKGGYPSAVCNGGSNGITHPLLAAYQNGVSKDAKNCETIPGSYQNESEENEMCLPVSKHRLRYTAKDCWDKEDWSEIGELQVSDVLSCEEIDSKERESNDSATKHMMASEVETSLQEECSSINCQQADAVNSSEMRPLKESRLSLSSSRCQLEEAEKTVLRDDMPAHIPPPQSDVSASSPCAIKGYTEQQESCAIPSVADISQPSASTELQPKYPYEVTSPAAALS